MINIKSIKNIKVVIFILFVSSMNMWSQTNIDQEKLKKLIITHDSLYASEILIIHNDKEVCYWQDLDCKDKRFYTSSMLKSWTGLVFGTLVDNGIIKDLHQKVCDWIPEWTDGCEKSVTIRHLLTMTAGFNRRGGAKGILAQEDNFTYLMSSKMERLPDSKWDYSNESVQLLGIILERASGMSTEEYFRKVLFDPLGMKNTRLVKDPSGKSWIVYGGAVTTIHEVAKIGQLILNKGIWHGKRIISEEWLKMSFEPSKLAPYYGFLWWLDPKKYSKHNLLTAMGDPGNIMTVYPELKLIFVRSQVCENNDPKYSINAWSGVHIYDQIGDVLIQN